MPRRKDRASNKKTQEKGKKKDEKEEQYFNEIIHVDEDVPKDFEFLVNAPVSEDDHFVLQSEKSWTIDVSQYSEYFTLDLKLLSAAIESIPFNKNVNVDAKYFTDDQMTNMYNKAEQGKDNYTKILKNLETQVVSSTEHTEESQNSLEDTTEELDFLLSLQEPVDDPLMALKSLSTSCSTDTKISAKPGTSTKPTDLEKWLDSVLGD